MAFVPRIKSEILDDMIAFVELQTDLTDYEVGSAVRTILEAAAIEDDEQYFQMVQLLDAFRLSTAAGADLDGRVQEYGITRLPPQSATGEIVIQDGNLITSELALDAASAATSLILNDSSEFPTSGFPYTVRIGEGTTSVEDVLVSANTVGTNTLTVAALTFDHSAGERVSYVDGTADVVLSPGIRVQVPANGTDPAVVFVSIETGTLVNGNFSSTPIGIRAEVPGITGNKGVGQITEFTTSAPFSGAAVTNQRNTNGGADLESDADLRDRARAAIQSLTAGTVLALGQGVLGVTDDVTGQRVTTSSVVESFVFDEVTVYIDDGTGFDPDEVVLARSTLSVADPGGSGTLTVVDSTDFPEEGFILVSPENPAQIEVQEFSGVDHGTHVITLVGTTSNAHDIGDEVALLDVVEDSAEAGTNFFQLANFPVIDNSLRLWVDTGAGPVLQVEDTDYVFCRGKGTVEFIGSGLAAGAAVYASYTYYVGLVASVQKVIDGDPDDPVNFPGIAAAGVKVIAEVPTIRRITVTATITARAGVQKDNLIPNVREAIEAYINDLGIGEDVIVAEMVERAMAVAGMFDISFTAPTSNIVVLETELPVPFDTDGSSLVAIT